MGDVWEWTSSGWDPIPASLSSRTGVLPGVLRAAITACCAAARSATDPRGPGHFRNWDHPIRRQIFAGFRLAWNA